MESPSEYIVIADSLLAAHGFVSNGAMKVKDGYIVDIENKRSFPRVKKVLDYRGYTVSPCFCDYHLHFFENNPLKLLDKTESLQASGITEVHDGGSPDCNGRKLKNSAHNNLSIKTVGYALYKKGGYGSIIGKGVENIEEAERHIDRLSQSGVDYIKLIHSGVYMPETGEISAGGFNNSEIARIVFYARAKGLQVACHANGEKAVREAVEAGVSAIIHGLYVSGETLSVMAEKDIAFIPTVHAFACLKKISKTGEALSNIDKVVVHHLSQVKNASDKGVKVLPGSDSGASFLPYGDSYHKELCLFQKVGIPVEKVLTSAGASPLERGAKADFLVLDGLTVKKVYISGRRFNG